MSNILVAGGDGFCGWPLSLKLSKLGYNVIILDNLSRRKIDVDLGCSSLTPIQSIEKRISTWKEVTNCDIKFELIDLSTEFDKICNLVRKYKPSAVIQFAEQRAAPYSMKNSSTRRYTVNNNLNATHNLLNAIVEVNQDIHFVHLGTMGVYGYGTLPNTIIPEGYVNVKMADKTGEYSDVEILHPAYPGSVYHMTKTQDALFFQFYAKNYGLKITDLHQGIIWGLHTEETRLHPNLINRFDYDGDYGTVLNRFIMQAAHDYPLTVYGTGGQTRAFIHIQNSMECICIALKNPPNRQDRVMILNQMTETHTVGYLADLLKKIYPKTEVKHISNPRKELIKNDLTVENKQFLALGLKPIYLDSDRIVEIYDAVKEFKDRVDVSHILPKSFW